MPSRSILEAGCSKCEDPFLPVSIKDSFVCINENEAQNYIANGLIQGCQRYSQNGDCLECDPNSGLKFIKTTENGSTCVSRCSQNSDVPSYKTFTLDISGDKKVAMIAKRNVCSDNTIEGCILYSPSLELSTIGADKCLKCSEEKYISVVNINDYNYFVYLDDEITTEEENFHQMIRHSSVRCVEQKSIESDSLTSPISAESLVENCKYYINVSGSNFTCIRCVNGYSGVVDSVGTMKSCTLCDNCTGEEYENLSVAYSRLYSFHRCKVDQEIPFLYIHENHTDQMLYENFDGSFSFGIFIVDRYGNIISSESAPIKNLVCLSNSETIYRAACESASFESLNFEKCALAFISTSIDNISLVHSYKSYCTARKPGYSVDLITDNDKTAKRCVKIANCKEAGNVVNGCKICEEGFVFTYKEGKLNRNICAPIYNANNQICSNCYSASVELDVPKSCTMCKKGYSPNKNGICVVLKTLFCENSQYVLNHPSEITNLGWSLYLSSPYTGCNKCTTNYLAYHITNKVSVCINSTTTAVNDFDREIF